MRKLIRNRRKDTDDTEKYNPFLYYYIPPDIPLDDELTHAARQSAMNRNNAQKAMEQNSEENDSSSSSEIPIPVVNLNKDDSSINGQSNIDKFDEKEEEEDDDEQNCFPRTDSLDDTQECILDCSQEHILERKFYIYDTDSMSKSDESYRNLDMKSNGQEIVPQELINYYVSMADPEQCVDMGAEIPHHCAFSFPAVALTLGKENWHCLKKAYQSLSSAKHWKVRRTLASSIHEIAMILGEELTATDLVPIYDGFIKDLDEVRIGVLKHLATFLEILKPTDRCQYLPRLSDFLATDNEWNWRFREELAMQLLEIVGLFSPNDVALNIAPLSFQLLVDKVAAVRTIALELVRYLNLSHILYFIPVPPTNLNSNFYRSHG